MVHLFSFFNNFLRTEFEVVAFYPYTSITTIRLAEENHNFESLLDQTLEKFFETYMEQAEKLGARRDNKVVIELAPKYQREGMFHRESHLFVGRYDDKVSIGLGVFQPDDWTKQYNMKLKNGKLERIVKKVKVIRDCITISGNRIEAGEICRVIAEWADGTCDIRSEKTNVQINLVDKEALEYIDF